MAGIGFELRNILAKGGCRHLVTAYAFSAVVAAGPWLTAMAALAMLNSIANQLLPASDIGLFRGVVIIVYAASLTLSGGLQLGTTRYVSDCLFQHNSQVLMPCYRYLVLLVVAGATLPVATFFYLAGLATLDVMAAVLLFQGITLTWIGMVFLAASRDYLAIVRLFVYGYALSAVGGIIGAANHGFSGLLWGFALGQGAQAGLLGQRVQAEFKGDADYDPSVWRHWLRHPALWVAGIAYNLGIWIDKILFWYGPHGTHLHGWFYTAYNYNVCLFLAYLTMVPAMALFLIRIETGFYQRYTAFYDTILTGATLAGIQAHKQQIVAALRLSAVRLVKLQTGVALLTLLAAPKLLAMAGLPPYLVSNFRLAVLAALAQILFLLIVVMLLYFDWRTEAAAACLVFLLANVFFTICSWHWGERLHGSGYFLACMLALVLAVKLFDDKMGRLEAETFTKQPMRAPAAH